ncbi:MAG: glycosyltransferase [candidate division FCPU426 bacterium]
MKVLVISHSAVVGLYRRKFHALAKLGCELHLVLPEAWPEGGRWVEAPAPGWEEGIQIHRLPGWGLGRVGGFWLKGLPELVRQVEPELIHVEEEPYSLVCGQALRLARRHRRPLVFFTWENIFRGYKWPLSWVDRWVVSRARWAIAGNQAAREVLARRGFHGECLVLPQYGVDPEVFRPQAREPGLKRTFTIGYFGRLLEEKGLDTLLAAVRSLPCDWRLQITGSGPHAPLLRARVEQLGLEPRVEFIPAIPNDHMPEALGRLDVLVLPSETRPFWKEQFGRVLVEAMACEVPVIGSDSGEIPFVIGEAGMIFPEGRWEMLAGQLQKIQSQPSLAAFYSRKGRERVLAHFTTDRLARETYKWYRRLRDQEAA